MLNFIGGLGFQEVLLIALVVLLFFGGKKIPEMMKGLGKGVKAFKDGMKEVETDVKVEANEETKHFNE
ncbi:MAG: twin-arginine translocase TatA/TatE family subunit [Muribaculaceae bacterium]|nr:twin-arginine translocase TatA/TatE family subunit [Muribaculaceae bacterium]